MEIYKNRITKKLNDVKKLYDYREEAYGAEQITAISLNGYLDYLNSNFDGKYEDYIKNINESGIKIKIEDNEIDFVPKLSFVTEEKQTISHLKKLKNVENYYFNVIGEKRYDVEGEELQQKTDVAFLIDKNSEKTSNVNFKNFNVSVKYKQNFQLHHGSTSRIIKSALKYQFKNKNFLNRIQKILESLIKYLEEKNELDLKDLSIQQLKDVLKDITFEQKSIEEIKTITKIEDIDKYFQKNKIKNINTFIRDVFKFIEPNNEIIVKLNKILLREFLEKLPEEIKSKGINLYEFLYTKEMNSYFNNEIRFIFKEVNSSDELKKYIVNESLTGVGVFGVDKNILPKRDFIYNIEENLPLEIPNYLAIVGDDYKNVFIRKIDEYIINKLASNLYFGLSYNKNKELLKDLVSYSFSVNRFEIGKKVKKLTESLNYELNEDFKNLCLLNEENIIKSSYELIKKYTKIFFNKITDGFKKIIKNIFYFLKKTIYDFINKLKESKTYYEVVINIKKFFNLDEISFEMSFNNKTYENVLESVLPSMHSYNMTPSGDIAQSDIFKIEFPSVYYQSGYDNTEKTKNSKITKKDLNIGDFVLGIELNTNKERKGNVVFIGYSENGEIDFVIINGKDNKKYVLTNVNKIEKHDNK